MAVKEHWESVHAESGADEVSWFQREPATSLRLLERAGVGPAARVIDVGCGAAGLATALARAGWSRVTGVDVSEAALARAREILGPALAERVRWIRADVLELDLAESFDVWHDRAVFHFLTRAEDRARYVAALDRHLAPGGHVVMGTFALDGPEQCSGLPVARYDPEGLAHALGPAFVLVAGDREEHVTPWDTTQAFTWGLFRRVGAT